MNLQTALKNRRSIRRYEQKAVPRDVLYDVAEMCRFAPSAGNRQEWELILVDEAEKVEGVFDTLAWLPAVGPPPDGKRPTAYIVVISNEKADALADCAAVTTYILLAGYARGLGSCWFGSIRRTELSTLLDIPDSYSVEFVVALGYPDEKMQAVNSKGECEVEVMEGVTHVPKRVVPDVLHVNSFGNGGEQQ